MMAMVRGRATLRRGECRWNQHTHAGVKSHGDKRARLVEARSEPPDINNGEGVAQERAKLNAEVEEAQGEMEEAASELQSLLAEFERGESLKSAVTGLLGSLVAAFPFAAATGIGEGFPGWLSNASLGFFAGIIYRYAVRGDPGNQARLGAPASMGLAKACGEVNGRIGSCGLGNECLGHALLSSGASVASALAAAAVVEASMRRGFISRLSS